MATTIAPLNKVRDAVENCGELVRRAPVPSRLAMSGTAMNAKTGIIRMEQRAAYRLAINKSKSRRRRGTRDQLRTASAARISNSNGQYSAWWKLGDAHSTMYCCMAGEKRVLIG